MLRVSNISIVSGAPTIGKMKSRVLFLDHVNSMGGAELALMDVAEVYRATSSVVLFAHEGPLRERLQARGIRTFTLGGAALSRIRRHTLAPSARAVMRTWGLARDVAKLARSYDVIYANTQKALVVASMATAMVRRPLVWDLHDLLSREHFSSLNIRVSVTLGNRCAAAVITNSDASAAAFVASGGCSRKVRVVHNGIVADKFRSVSSADVRALRTQLQVSDEPVVAMFGRLAEWKGQHVALEALSQLVGVQLLLVGDAIFGEHAYVEMLRSQAAALGISDRVRFLGFRDDIPRLMHLADVIVHASIAPEPFGRVVVEGMLAGRPVVATGAGGIMEIIDDGLTGVLVRPSDPTALAVAIKRLLADPDYSREMGRRARETAELRFSVASMVTKKSTCIEEVAAGVR